jgi:hypothetical protein
MIAGSFKLANRSVAGLGMHRYDRDCPELLAEQPEQHRQTLGAENQRQDTAGFPCATRLPH